LICGRLFLPKKLIGNANSGLIPSIIQQLLLDGTPSECFLFTKGGVTFVIEMFHVYCLLKMHLK